MFKKIMAVVLGVLMLTGSTVMAAAKPAPEEPQSGISPRLKYVASAVATVSISGGKAKVVGTVKRTSSGTEIDATVTLERYDGGSWVEVDSWSDSTTDITLALRGTSGTLEKGKYRAVVDYTVYGGGGSESGSKTSNTATY